MKNTQVGANCARFEVASFARERKRGEKSSGFTTKHRAPPFPFSTVVEKQVLRRFDWGWFVPRIARAPYFSPALRLWLYFLEIVTREMKRDVRRKRERKKVTRERFNIQRMEGFKRCRTTFYLVNCIQSRLKNRSLAIVYPSFILIVILLCVY